MRCVLSILAFLFDVYTVVTVGVTFQLFMPCLNWYESKTPHMHYAGKMQTGAEVIPNMVLSDMCTCDSLTACTVGNER